MTFNEHVFANPPKTIGILTSSHNPALPFALTASYPVSGVPSLRTSLTEVTEVTGTLPHTGLHNT